MQEHMPTPDPELTQTLQAAISDYDAGTHFCMAGTQSLDPDELSQSVTFLKSANSRMNARCRDRASGLGNHLAAEPPDNERDLNRDG